MGVTISTDRLVLPTRTEMKSNATRRIRSIRKSCSKAIPQSMKPTKSPTKQKGNLHQVAARGMSDTDDDEVADLSIPIPRFARELIETLDKEEAKIESEDIDPILLTKIRPESLKYEFVRENGTSQLFRASSLIDYMLATRHFHDPETRIEFTDDQLAELDRIGTQLGKESVLIAKLDGEWVKQKHEDDEDAFAGVERIAGEHVFDMIRIIERTRKSQAQEAEMELLCRVFPFYRYYVTLMFGLNWEETVVAVDQFKRFLVGPPNRPTVDRSHALLKFCLDFMDEVIKDLWES